MSIRSLALALALLIPAAGTVHARPLAVHPSPAGTLDTFWRWVSSHIPWNKEGGTMDPDGSRHTLPTPPITTNAGGTMDPDG